MFLVSSWSCLRPIHWIQVLSRVDHSDVVGASPVGDASTTSEWATSLLPTKLQLVSEILRDGDIRWVAVYLIEMHIVGRVTLLLRCSNIIVLDTLEIERGR